MIKVSGDFAAKMTRWAELLESSKLIVSTMSKVAAEVSLTLIGEGFENETDPYGEKWASKKTPDGRKVLHGETTRLRNGWHVTGSDASGFEVAPSVDYAGYHQSGTSKMVPRKMVPDASRGLPKEWADEFKAIAMATAINHFGSAANGAAPTHKRPETSSGGGGGGGSRKRATSTKRGLKTLKRLRTR